LTFVERIAKMWIEPLGNVEKPYPTGKKNE